MIDTEPTLRAADHRARRGHRRDWVIAAVLLVLAGWVGWQQVRLDDQADTARQQRDAATAQSVTFADQVLRACGDTDVLARQLAAAGLCGQAAEVRREPVPGEPGPAGEPGRGITTTAVTPAGDLIITYTDGTTESKGRVVGRDGQPGPAGRGVRSATVTDGRLVVSYTDGTSETVGVVVGPAGAVGVAGRDGEDGEDGRGVQSVTVNADRHLVVRYSDGSSSDAGEVPTVAGPAGPPGPAGPACPEGTLLVSRVIDPDGLGPEPLQTWRVCVEQQEQP